MSELELLVAIEREARALLDATAAAAADDELALEHGRRAPLARVAWLVAQIAVLLSRLPARGSGNLRILRAKVAHLAELAEDEDTRVRFRWFSVELARHIGEDEQLEQQQIASAFERKVG